jgi:toxin YoeB
MRVMFSQDAFAQYADWQRSDPNISARLNALIVATMRTPFSGIGKPEPLRGELQGFWSRRITQEHRLVYRVSGSGAAQTLEIAACRFHYGK